MDGVPGTSNHAHHYEHGDADRLHILRARTGQDDVRVPSGNKRGADGGRQGQDS